MHRRRGVPALLALLVLLVFATFVALGTWQVQRAGWKRGLIERVEQRVHAAPVAAPSADRWPAITAASDEYRRVEARGVYIDARPVLVQAVTDLGAGFWVLAPLRQADGSLVIVNRGFVPAEARGRVAAVSGPARVTGLLRISEPRGGFLRLNDPNADRWYSRDVPAIADARGWHRVAPYFIDAEVQPGALPDAPAGGLTVIAFNDHHTVYAATWFTLALMTAAAAWWLLRGERVGRRD